MTLIACGGGSGGGGGGGGAAPVMKECNHSVPASNEPDQPDVKEAVKGTNGIFTDECTPDGKLIEYSCEIVPDNGPYHEPMKTGRVVPSTIDCGGPCVDGACPAP